MLLTEMPNADSLVHRRYGRHWNGLDAPRYLVVLTRGALARLLAESGFELSAWLRPALRDVNNDRPVTTLRAVGPRSGPLV